MSNEEQVILPKTKYFLLYDKSTAEYLKEIAPLVKERKEKITIMAADEFLDREGSYRTGESIRILICAGLSTIKKITVEAEKYGYILSFLPIESQNLLRKSYSLPSDPVKIMDIFLYSEPGTADMIQTNEGTPVLCCAIIGDAPLMDARNGAPGSMGNSGKIGYLLNIIRKIKKLKLFTIELESAKKFKIKTVLSSITIYRGGEGVYASSLIGEKSYNDGQVRALLVSPRSLMSYLHYLMAVLFPVLARNGTLVSTGFIKSKEITIRKSSSQEPLRLFIDGEEKEVAEKDWNTRTQ